MDQQAARGGILLYLFATGFPGCQTGRGRALGRGAQVTERCSIGASRAIGMLTYALNPLTDRRWQALLDRHPSASVFHTPGWLGALQRTYGYEPVVMTTCPPTAELTNGVAFCQVKSVLTGSRWVSLPFSDHCEPLAGSAAEMDELLSSIARLRVTARYKYAELRPLSVSPAPDSGFSASTRFVKHKLLLPRNPAEVFGRFSKDCIQRKIRRAEREHLSYEEGRSEKSCSANSIAFS